MNIPQPDPNPLASFTPEQKEQVIRAIAQVWQQQPSWITEGFVVAFAAKPQGTVLQ